MARAGLGRKAIASSNNSNLRAQKRTRWPERMSQLRQDPIVGTAGTEVRAPGRPCKRKSVRGRSSSRAGAGRLAIGRSTAADLVGRMFVHLDPGQDLSESNICH